MRSIASLFLLFVLAACGTVQTLTVPVEPAKQVSFVFVDNRTPFSRTTGSATTGSGRAGSFADDNMRPTPPELVKTWLQSAFPTQLVGKTVTLESFDFGVVTRSGLHADAQPAGVAAVDSVLTPRITFLKIAVSVDGSKISIDVYEKFFGMASEADLRGMLERARVEFVGKVRRVIPGT